MIKPAELSVAAILRARGFVPVPRLWIKAKDMPAIHRITSRYREEVCAVRAEVRERLKDQPDLFDNFEEENQDPKTSKEAAWEAMERLQNGS